MVALLVFVVILVLCGLVLAVATVVINDRAGIPARTVNAAQEARQRRSE